MTFLFGSMLCNRMSCRYQKHVVICFAMETSFRVRRYHNLLLSGRRLVRPYFFEFIAHVKKRWDGKTIIDLFAQEFRQRSTDYYDQAIKAGRILVDGKMVTRNYVVRASQTLSHFVHRHEPPVMADPVTILEMTPDVVIVCKPASIPVHPCGQYRKNTVVSILQAENDVGPIYPIHRLDRLVSGLLIFARSAEIADNFRLEIEAGTVQKQYVSKVRGVFPPEEIEVNAAVTYNAREGRSTVEENEIKCEPNEKSESGNRNRKTVGPEGSKRASTKFQRLDTDGAYSIVECHPITGRTHQIRVHLQHLGHPIANDALYAIENPSHRSEMGTTADRAARSRQITVRSNEPFALKLGKRKADAALLDQAEGSEIPQAGGNEDCKHMFVMDQMCTHCPNLAPCGYEEDDEFGLWLHCVRYSGQGWEYNAPLPDWVHLAEKIL